MKHIPVAASSDINRSRKSRRDSVLAPIKSPVKKNWWMLKLTRFRRMNLAANSAAFPPECQCSSRYPIECAGAGEVAGGVRGTGIGSAVRLIAIIDMTMLSIT